MTRQNVCCETGLLHMFRLVDFNSKKEHCRFCLFVPSIEIYLDISVVLALYFSTLNEKFNNYCEAKVHSHLYSQAL